MGEIKFEGGPLAAHARKIMFWACGRFGVVGFVEKKVPVIGEKDGVTGKVVVGPFEIVEVFVHVEEDSIGEEVVEEVLAVVELAVGEVESEEMYQRGLPYDEMSQSTYFGGPSSTVSPPL